MSAYILNFHDTVLLATGFQSLLFILLILWVKHERHISDYFLIGFFVAQIAIPLHVLVNYNPELRALGLQISPKLFHIFDIAYWIEGPLLLWYTRSMLRKNFTLRKKDVLYLLPTAIYFIYMSVAFYSLGALDKAQFLAAELNADAPSVRHGIEAVREGLRVFFGILCLVDIRRARNELRDRFSNIEKIDIGWLSILVIAFTAVRVWILIVVSVAIFAPYLGGSVFNYMGLAGNYLTFGLITALMFLSLQRSSIFDGHMTEEAPAQGQDNQSLDPALAKKIENHMLHEKPYLLPLLNLEQLASQLSMHPRALSVAIKKHFKTNFYEFVNSYRINEAKLILSDPEQKHKTMIDISGECGFNSKATYNSFFKKLVGSTPTQYRSEQLSAQLKN
ncbi:MAG: AraC-like DNA-binding protein [Arenicella sp.]|jgi:AraC-like DNA-binding protein